ncbi:MAG: hypothetical protein AAGA66_07360 [Bacteroidota bacterium]
MSALYVSGMPFKLLDESTSLQYDGKVALASGVQAAVIKATYHPGKHANHSTQDAWCYYFDADDGQFYGSLVHHPPTYAYIENMEVDTTTHMQFPKHRKSYRSDSACTSSS